MSTMKLFYYLEQTLEINLNGEMRQIRHWLDKRTEESGITFLLTLFPVDRMTLDTYFFCRTNKTRLSSDSIGQREVEEA